jgi:hypothetical protein
VSEADGMLHLLAAEPTLLDPAPSDVTARQMDERAANGARSCLRCGKPARTALVAETRIGNRWLDLCRPCLHWLRANLAEGLRGERE